jgi:hypothetical protein
MDFTLGLENNLMGMGERLWSWFFCANETLIKNLRKENAIRKKQYNNHNTIVLTGCLYPHIP